MKRQVTLILLAILSVSASFADGLMPFVPSNPPAMKPLPAGRTPAYVSAQGFRHGVNLGNYLEFTAGMSGVQVSAREFRLMRVEGFDHVRVPVAWSQYTGPGPEYLLPEGIFGRVDWVITNALNQQLSVIVDVHHFRELNADPSGQADRLSAIWKQVAAHYADYPNKLAFEILNEPCDQATADKMNPIYDRVIREIRGSNPHRTIFVDTCDWASIVQLNTLVLPPDDNLVVEVHCYDPFYFTHQGASWGGADVQVRGIQFPGPPAKPLEIDPGLKLQPYVLRWMTNYNTLPAEKNPSGPAAFLEKLAFARAWSDHYGRPVYVGEFGCYTTADPESRVRYYKAFREALDAQKLGWAVWDWSAGFNYWDKTKGQPVAGMREALFPSSRK
ncbi:MAG: glycoside hydrolase family 5 protein [Verrucomicrobiota bacterium]